MRGKEKLPIENKAIQYHIAHTVLYSLIPDCGFLWLWVIFSQPGNGVFQHLFVVIKTKSRKRLFISHPAVFFNFRGLDMNIVRPSAICQEKYHLLVSLPPDGILNHATEAAENLNGKAGFLTHLPQRGFLLAFSQLYMALWEAPIFSFDIFN